VLALLEDHMEDAVRRLAPGTSLREGRAPVVPPDGVDIEPDTPAPVKQKPTAPAPAMPHRPSATHTAKRTRRRS
ncbi:MAG: hypothetical protein ACRDQ5_07405, partial [Sciscionella sp.]